VPVLLPLNGRSPVQHQTGAPVYDELDDVKQGNGGMACTAVEPVGVEAKPHPLRVGAHHHVMEFARGMVEFDVVVMVGQLEV
jgi:hypothetical protein